jgi:two-component system, OmpR family, response regulator ArlR
MKDYRILIIEDEKQMAQLLEMELVHEGYIVDKAYDGIAALDILENADYDLVLLDIMLPGLNGIEVCRRLRQFSNVPVIMLTAKGDVSDKVAGLDAGANDYLPKPFAIEELLARVRVYTRGGVPKNVKNRLVLNDIIMDNEKHQVWRAGKEIELTKKEYDLLEMLLINKNVVLSRDQLIQGVWGYDYEGETNVVDVFIRYLRSKLDDGFEKKVINTVRGVGYVIKGD